MKIQDSRQTRTLLALGIVAALSGVGGAAQAAGNVAAGQQKAYFCSTCHGLDGNATVTGTPRLAGMAAKQFTAHLKAYKSGKVASHPMMAILTSGLNDQDIADLAAFYASRQPEDSLRPYSSPALK